MGEKVSIEFEMAPTPPLRWRHEPAGVGSHVPMWWYSIGYNIAYATSTSLYCAFRVGYAEHEPFERKRRHNLGRYGTLEEAQAACEAAYAEDHAT